MSDPLLQRYSVIMIDDIHERNIYTDIILGLLKKYLIFFPLHVYLTVYSQDKKKTT